MVKIVVECNNEAVVSVLQNSKTSDPLLAPYIRDTKMLAAQFDIDMWLVHIAGAQSMVADLLSSWNQTDNYVHKLALCQIRPPK